MKRHLLAAALFAPAILALGLLCAPSVHAEGKPCLCESVPIEVSPALSCTIELRCTYPDGKVVGLVLLPGAKTSIDCADGLVVEMRIGGNCWATLTSDCTAIYGVSGAPSNCCVTACLYGWFDDCWSIHIGTTHKWPCQMCADFPHDQ